MEKRLNQDVIDLNNLKTKGYYIINPSSKLINNPDEKYQYKYIFVIVKSVDPITNLVVHIKQICMPADTSEVIFTREMYHLEEYKIDKFTEWKEIKLEEIKNNYQENTDDKN